MPQSPNSAHPLDLRGYHTESEAKTSQHVINLADRPRPNRNQTMFHETLALDSFAIPATSSDLDELEPPHHSLSITVQIKLWRMRRRMRRAWRGGVLALRDALTGSSVRWRISAILALLALFAEIIAFGVLHIGQRTPISLTPGHTNGNIDQVGQPQTTATADTPESPSMPAALASAITSMPTGTIRQASTVRSVARSAATTNSTPSTTTGSSTPANPITVTEPGSGSTPTVPVVTDPSGPSDPTTPPTDGGSENTPGGTGDQGGGTGITLPTLPIVDPILPDVPVIQLILGQ